MSQRRVKKQLSMLDNVEELTDHELRDALKKYNQTPGPLTDSTRNLYRKKLASLLESGDDPKDLPSTSLEQTSSKKEKTNVKANKNSGDKAAKVDEDDDDDDTSDEDYQESEESEESEDDEDGDEDLEDEPEKLLAESEEYTIKVSNLSFGSANESASISVGPDAVPNRISKGILLILVSFFVVIFSCYLYSRGNHETLHQLYRNVARYSVVLLVLSPIVIAAYRIIRSYRLRRHEEMQRVCGLVNEALELLQSPDNPKGLMPILHIRDTLLTPPERKTKKMTSLWNEAVKFIEEHESRVKVELVNIDGEDFRAWKWIGSRKLI